MRMKKFLSLLIASMLLYGCSIDERGIIGRLDNLEGRVSKLEELCSQMNTNISSLQTIVVALQKNDYITSVAPIIENGVEVGYTITFAKSNPITIYHGHDGKDGANGTDGKDGQAGADGQDGYSPVIGIRQDADGVYYWTLDGEWLLDDDGNKIKAVGVDGEDGKDGYNGQDGSNGVDGTDGKDGQDGAPGANGTDGADGEDGITPQLKIEEGYWYISYDNGASWTKLGKATGEDGKDGADGTDGKDGQDGKDGVEGKDGDSFFAGVDTSDENYVIFTLVDGTEIRIPTWHAFEELKKLCNQMNTNISSLQAIVEALQNNDYITSVTPIVENGTEIGYTISFAKSNPVTVYHGKNGTDGADGKDGIDGSDGKDGVNGTDGHTPVIGIRQDTDGVYYWTLDGGWLLDENGNKIKAVGADGADGTDGEDGKDGQDGAPGTDGQNGTNGTDGKDGITPQLKIEEGYWLISYDNGATWTKLGKATGEDGADGKDGENGKDGVDGTDGTDGKDGVDGKDGDSMFKEIKQDENNVYFVLMDGTEIVVPKQKELSITFSDSEIGILAGKSTTVDYVITGATDKTVVKAFGQGGWYAKVSPSTSSTGTITVTAPDPLVEDEIIVLVNDGEYRSIMTSVNFVTGVITPSTTAIEFEKEGGTQEMQVETNLAYEVKIPADAKSWLTVSNLETKAMRTDNITITCAANESTLRSAIITITDLNGNEISGFSVIQYGEQEPGTLINGVAKLAEAGTLATVLGDQMLTLTSLKIIGDINGTDVKYLRQMLDGGHWSSPKGILNNLDLIDASIVEGGDYYATEYNSFAETTFYYYTSNNTIGRNMFDYCYGLQSIQLPKNVTDISFSAFEGCKNLANVALGDDVTIIYADAFKDCTSLKSIMIPDKVTKIGSCAFYGCSSLTNVSIPNSVKSIGDRAFCGCTLLDNVTIPNSVTTIEQNAFSGCTSLTSISIPESVTDLGSGLFSSCSSLTYISIPKNITIITNSFCSNCSSLANVIIPDGAITIEQRAFYQCEKLTEIIIPNNVTSIGGMAFNNCSALESVTIGKSVTTIDVNAFTDCVSLSCITCYATTPPEIDAEYDTFSTSIAFLKVPKGTKNVYKASNWSKYFTTIEELN